MFDVIECFQSASPAKPTRQIVFQTTNQATAQSQADILYRNSSVPPESNVGRPRVARTGASTFVVVDRSTARELYRVPSDTYAPTSMP